MSPMGVPSVAPEPREKIEAVLERLAQLCGVTRADLNALWGPAPWERWRAQTLAMYVFRRRGWPPLLATKILGYAFAEGRYGVEKMARWQPWIEEDEWAQGILRRLDEEEAQGG